MSRQDKTSEAMTSCSEMLSALIIKANKSNHCDKVFHAGVAFYFQLSSLIEKQWTIACSEEQHFPKTKSKQLFYPCIIPGHPERPLKDVLILLVSFLQSLKRKKEKRTTQAPWY